MQGRSGLPNTKMNLFVVAPTGMRTRITVLSCPDLCDFFGHALIKAFGIDDIALMGTP